METVVSFLKATWAIFTFARFRAEQNNSPEMKAAATAKVDESVKAEATKAVADGDLEAIRKGLSE